MGFAFTRIRICILLAGYRIIGGRISRWILESKAVFRRCFFRFGMVVLGFDAVGRSS